MDRGRDGMWFMDIVVWREWRWRGRGRGIGRVVVVRVTVAVEC